MEQRERLRHRKDFAAVSARGQTFGRPLLVFRILPNGLEHNRHGFVVSKRLGKAVERNRVKRLLREAVRLTPTHKGWDLVFIARPPLAGASLGTVAAVVGELLGRAGLGLRPGR